MKQYQMKPWKQSLFSNEIFLKASDAKFWIHKAPRVKNSGNFLIGVWAIALDLPQQNLSKSSIKYSASTLDVKHLTKIEKHLKGN